MPRGWKKRQEFGSKVRRGGSSHSTTKQTGTISTTTFSSSRSSHTRKRRHLALDHDDRIDYSYAFDKGEDFDLYSYDDIDEDHSICPEQASEEQCPICCEVKPLFSFMKKCHHAPACQQCYREIYIKHAQENVSNFPIKCYYPSCELHVATDNLVRHNLFHNIKEFKKHNTLTALSKAYKDPTRNKIVNCPNCEVPKVVRTQNISFCIICKTRFAVVHEGVTHKLTTMKALDELKNDKFGRNDGWANCPNCDLIISKGDGCNHMICICGKHFSWYDAVAKRARKVGSSSMTTATAKSVLVLS
mmetsp:Transcript_5683/g.8626  ORF Transcript_5683/g.8626 Transcript_5683/m.8626 type:complete len:302 (-) Transcript_5683:53-958(-)